MGMIKDGVYYNSQGDPSHRGVVKIDDKLYYAGKDGVIVKDKKKTIHHGMANGLLKHGVYYFDADGVCDVKSFKSSKKNRHKSSKNSKFNLTGAKKTFFISALAVVIFAAIGLFIIFDLRAQLPGSDQTASEKSQQQVSITVPGYEDEVYLCSNALKAYYQGNCSLQEARELSDKAYQPFKFNYTITNADSATLLLGEKEDYSDATTYELDLSQNYLFIDNLKTNTTYHYQVTAKDSEGESTSKTGSMKTADTNRFVFFTGVYNTRDIGGYDTLYGKKVKQGLVIRGTELDGLKIDSFYLQDVAETEPFHFVYDFDLRNSNVFIADYVSKLGEDVTHKFYNSPSYGDIFSSRTVDALNEIFSDLADPDIYPMYMHCTHGIDRAGTIVFLLQGLLGVSEEDMLREYELSGFFDKEYIYGKSILPILSGLQNIPGSTINEKIENFLIDSIGITEEQIESIREIFLEQD